MRVCLLTFVSYFPTGTSEVQHLVIAGNVLKEYN